MVKKKTHNSSMSYDMLKKQNTSQVPLGISFLLLTMIVGFILTSISNLLGFYWFSGMAFGLILQKSRFCFTAAIRDPYLIGITPLTKAVLIALALTTIGFTAIKYGAFINGEIIPGQHYIRPITLATAIGGMIFGIGMVISSGCASGTLMRVGEGFQTHIITLVFFVIGSIWGIHDLGWWNKYIVLSSDGIFLPDKLGWFGAISLQLLVIAILYYIADQWQKKKMNDDDEQD